jgi:hypothetical protein
VQRIQLHPDLVTGGGGRHDGTSRAFRIHTHHLDVCRIEPEVGRLHRDRDRTAEALPTR